MKIVGIRIDGLRKLTAVEMEFAEKGLIQFRGKNKQGKTTILDAFEILLRGNKYVEDDMITHGKDKAHIIGYIGEYEVKRVITKKTNRIEIKGKDGSTLGKPQEFLDTLINELTFDPRPFLNKTPEQKLKFLMDLLKIDFGDIDSKIGECEQERLLLGRELKGIGELTPVQKVEKVSVTDLVEKKNEVVANNASLKAEYDEGKEKKVAEIREFNEVQKENKRVLEAEEKELSELEDEAQRLRIRLQSIENEIGDKRQVIALMPQPEPEKSLDVDMQEPEYEDTTAIDIQISEAEETNLKAQEYDTYAAKKLDKMKKQTKYGKVDGDIAGLRKEKKNILRSAKVPVEGLEIREDGLYFNDCYFENLGESEQLRISSELCIAMSPELRAGFLDKAEAYDPDSLKSLGEWAEKNDLQYFVTIVDGEDGTSEGDVFYIEDGSIV